MAFRRSFSLLLVIFISVASTAKMENPLKVYTQFLHLLNGLFKTCDVYITSDLQNHSSIELIDQISASLISPPHFHIYLDSYFQQVNWNSSTCSVVSCFPVSIRKHSQCSLVIGTFSEGANALPKFQELLVSPFKAPVKNELDHFVFFVPPQNLESCLLHSNLSIIKYKIGLPLYTPGRLPNQNIVGKTSCFFCNLDQKIISIDLTRSKSSDIFPDFTRNGLHHALKISGPLKYPFLYELEENSDGKWRGKRGVYKFLIDSMLSHFNYTFSVFPSSGHGSGQLSNGTWNGVVGDLVYGLADFGTATSPNPARFLLITYSTAMVYPFVTFMIGPPKVSYTWKAVYWPFTPDLWLAVLVSLAVVILTFKIMQIYDKAKQSLLMFRHLVEYTSFILIGQGIVYPNAHSSRILLTVWLLASMILNTLYVSKIVGLLAFPVYHQLPLTFKDLVESGFTWGFDHSGGNLFAHFKSSSNPVFHKIFEGMEHEKEAVDCFNTAIDHNFACITWAGVADFVAYKNLTLRHGKSPLKFANDITLFVSCGLSYPRRSLHVVNFDRIIGVLRDSGQIEKWVGEDLENLRRDRVHWQHRMNMAADDDGASDDGPDLLSLSNLLGIFYIYIAGHILAMGLFAGEMIRKRGRLAAFLIPEIRSL